MAICVALQHFGALKFSGPDAEKYLQGQITADITQKDRKVQFTCQCDSKGKTLSTFYIIQHGDEFILIGVKESLSLSLAAFQKFAVFSKLDITDISEQVLIVGLDQEQLKSQYSLTIPQELPDVSVEADTLAFKVQDQHSRFIVMQPVSLDAPKYSGSIQDWIIADIKAGLPHLSETASSEFIPQMLNLQALDAISFSKGCYMGQETVARAKYLGKNKRAAYILTGKCQQQPRADDIVEMQLGENWRRAGALANLAWQESDKTAWLYAVLPNDIDANDTNTDTEKTVILRIKSQPESRLSIYPLPYSLE